MGSNIESGDAIPKGSLILVTGANGFIGSHVVDQFLKHGYRVRGTARSEEKLQIAREAFERRHGSGNFEGVIVSDMTAEDAFKDAMKDVVGVAHVASDLSFGADPNKVITPVVTAMRNILKTAAKTPSIRRFVYTSSSTAALEPIPDKRFHVDKNTWNTDSSKIAWQGPPYAEERAFSVYSASKAESERIAWDFMEKEKPSFVLNAVLPNMNIGESLSSKLNPSTNAWILALWNNDPKEKVEFLKTFPPQYWINVRDDAKLHVGAMIYSDVKDERIFGFAGPWNYNTYVNAFREIAPPEKRKELPEPVDGLSQDLSIVDTKSALNLLERLGQSGWTSLDNTLREAISSN